MRLSALSAVLVVAATLLAAAPGHAGTPFVLPSTESAEAWRPALQMALFEPGVPGSGAWVELTDTGGGWLLRVHDVRGTEREVAVEAPTSAADREEIAFLAFSLLQPGAVAQPSPGPVAVVDPEPEPVVELPPIAVVEPEPEPVIEPDVVDPEPEPVAVREPEPAPAAEPAPMPPVEPEPVVEPEPAVEPEPQVEPEPEVEAAAPRAVRVAGWVTTLGGLDFRQRVRPTFGFELSGGVLLGPGFRLGVQAVGRTPGAVIVPSEIDRTGTYWELGAGGIISWSPDLPVGPIVGIALAGVRRSHTVDRAPAAGVWIPRLAIDTGLSIRATPWLKIEPMAQFRFDLKETHPLGRPTPGVGALPRFGLTAGLSLTVFGPR